MCGEDVPRKQSDTDSVYLKQIPFVYDAIGKSQKADQSLNLKIDN